MGWTTKNEINFIAKLGQHSLMKTQRKILLKRYLEAAQKRDLWYDIDKEEVLEYVKKSVD